MARDQDTKTWPFEVMPLTGTLGAEVRGCQLSSDMPDSMIEAIEDALVHHKVLFFRDQEMDSLGQLAFGRRFGCLETHPFGEQLRKAGFSSDDDELELFVVESKEDKPGRAEVWHSDVTWRDAPSKASILRCTVAAIGGDTMWADMAAAYAGLDDATKAQLAGLTAIHDWHLFRQLMRREKVSEETIVELEVAFPPAEHPVVTTHPVSGEKILFVNPAFTLGIKGMDKTESDALLERLYKLAWLPEYQVRFRWEPGSIAFWDNRSTQHYVVGDFAGQHRRLERVTIVGAKPS